MMTINLVNTVPCKTKSGPWHRYPACMGRCPECKRERSSAWHKEHSKVVNAARVDRYAMDPHVSESRRRRYQEDAYAISACERRLYSSDRPGARARDIKKKYGLSAEDYARILHSQGVRCGSCDDKLLLDKNTHIDHCHATGRVRGILCHSCNTALGLLKESRARIMGLAEYLERSKT